MKTGLKVTALLAITAALASTATAQSVNYVDATEGGNTLIAPSAGGGSTFTVTPFGTQGPADDGLWDARAFGNGATIYQNAGTGAGVDVNASRLVTSVSGLSADTYNVFVYFWTDNSPTWRIGASLGDDVGQLPLFQASTPGVVQFYTGGDATVLSDTLAPNPFSSAVMVAEGNRRLLQASLGQVTGTGFSVYIEGDRAMTGQDGRTWYDGVGYSAVPEPSTMALAGVGVLLGVFMIRRRRQ